jgi:hypothetical protein
MEYELEWQYADDPAPPVEYEPYIHFGFMLRFPKVPLGKDHVAHFCFNVLQEPQVNEIGIVVVRRGFVICIPFSKPDIMEFVEAAVSRAFSGSSREEALDRLNAQFINSDIDYSDEFVSDLIGADELLNLIDEAFDGVERGDGITLHQANVIDDYGSEEEFLAAAKVDTETRWQDIPTSALVENPQFLCFVDTAAFRYYIPAAMSFAVRKYDENDFETFFIYLAVLPTVAPRESGRGIGEAFDLEGFIREHSFTQAQVNAIYRFICFMAIEAEHGMDEDQFAAVKKWRQAASSGTKT